MTSLQLPDWRDIGRGIGKRLRDMLPPRDAGSSKEERLEQRMHDVLKGFAYFDTIDEALGWIAEDVDPIQKANTPILYRPSTEDERLGLKTKVMLCHDYKGGYHDYESVRPDTGKDEMYSCEYLQHVNSFIYFSHKVICIPPPSWTNTLHRNGVKVLATFIVEPQTPNVDRILTVKNGVYVMAEALANMALTFGFDGWLINIENTFAANVTKEIVAFIKCLKRFPGRALEVVWYDALNIENEVKYQNGLTEKNLPFAIAADALFTNYKWTESKLMESKQIALIHSMRLSKIIFGIDVWAQNTNMPGPPRVTFPKNGGGGTNTGLAVNTLQAHGFRPAIFGPAWTYEHFSSTPVADGSQQTMARSAEQSLWEGARLPSDLRCDCKKGKPHHTVDYQQHPITRHAMEFPGGSSTYFDSDFGRAFSEARSEDGQRLFRSTLGNQAVLPRLRPLFWAEVEEAHSRLTTRVVYGAYEQICDDAQKFETFLTIYTSSTSDSNPEEDTLSAFDELRPISTEIIRLCLYKVCVPVADGLSARLVYSKARESRNIDAGFYAAFKSAIYSDTHYEYYRLPYISSTMSESCFKLARNTPSSTLTEIGVYCGGEIECLKPMRLLHLGRLSVLPIGLLDGGPYDFAVDSLRLISRGNPSNQQKRLAWDWHGKRETWPKAMPWSDVTGPFSHFTVSMDGSEIGQSAALEYPLKREELGKASKTGSNGGPGVMSFSVRGHCFGGLPLKRAALATAFLSE
ncbi:hypothetical protein MMC13_005970 [Lambiella insularis]|nr:hypothetical protein [Lambiella insularis]